MNSQYWDNLLIDAQYEVGMNRIFLDTNMPIAISGTDKVDSDIIFPNSVVAFADKDVKASPLLPQANMGNLFAGMSAVEKSMDESSVSDVSAGQLPSGDQKATALNIAERNAKTLILGVGKTLAESIVQFGGLMSDIAINHLTIPQVEELSSGENKMKYRSFILKNKTVSGRNVSKVIKLDKSLLGIEMTDKEKKLAGMKLLEQAGYPNNNQEIYRVNPELFSRMKFLTRCEPERMFPKNEEFMQAMFTQLQKQMENNPYVSLEALTRKTLYQFLRGETEEVMKKPDDLLTQNAPETPTGTLAGNLATKSTLAKNLA